MREILFRGKRIYNNEWVYGNLVVDAHGESHIVPNVFFVEDGHHLRYEDDTDKPVFFDPDTLGQFTGLYAKGVKIFEGDIVCCSCYEVRCFNGVVTFKDGAFLVKREGDYFSLALFEKEVIGNIYDNPELLEDSK